MFNYKDVLETIDMIEREHLDIRTVTMGISLLPCIRATAEETARCVYDTVCKKAENIVKVTGELSREYGIPIVNKRVSVTPVSLICAPFADKSAWSAASTQKYPIPAPALPDTEMRQEQWQPTSAFHNRYRS